MQFSTLCQGSNGAKLISDVFLIIHLLGKKKLKYDLRFSTLCSRFQGRWTWTRNSIPKICNFNLYFKKIPHICCAIFNFMIRRSTHSDVKVYYKVCEVWLLKKSVLLGFFLLSNTRVRRHCQLEVCNVNNIGKTPLSVRQRESITCNKYNFTFKYIMIEHNLLITINFWALKEDNMHRLYPHKWIIMYINIIKLIFALEIIIIKLMKKLTEQYYR